MMLERDNWDDMLDDLLRDDSDTLSAWEVEFAESLDKQRNREGWSPSDKQFKYLSDIWHKVFG